jgi:hypothetical protein
MDIAASMQRLSDTCCRGIGGSVPRAIRCAAVAVVAIVMLPPPALTKDGERSHEIRWIGSGKRPDALAHWFKTVPGDEKVEKKRTDVYLTASDGDELSVKFREEQLEVKVRESSRDIATAEGKATGKAEVWRKWDWNLKSFQPKSKRTVDVTKERRQKFVNDCAIELTVLTAWKKIWWTVAYQVSGDPAELEQCLARTIPSGWTSCRHLDPCPTRNGSCRISHEAGARISTVRRAWRSPDG